MNEWKTAKFGQWICGFQLNDGNLKGRTRKNEMVMQKERACTDIFSTTCNVRLLEPWCVTFLIFCIGRKICVIYQWNPWSTRKTPQYPKRGKIVCITYQYKAREYERSESPSRFSLHPGKFCGKWRCAICISYFYKLGTTFIGVFFFLGGGEGGGQWKYGCVCER